MKHILVTGTSGFIGSSIKKYFSKNDTFQVHELAGRKDFKRLNQLKFPDGLSAIIHAGFEVDFKKASTKEASENVKNTERLIAFAREHGQPQFIFLSGAAVLGVSRKDRARGEEDVGTTDPEFVEYQASRYVQEKLQCEKQLESYPGPWTILYLTTVFGEGMPENTLSKLTKLGASRIPVGVCPPGGTSFLDLRDFLHALNATLTKEKTGRYVLSSGNIKFRDLFTTAAKVQGRSRTFIPIPQSLRKPLLKAASLASKEVAVLASSFGNKYYSPYKAMLQLGWKPLYSLEEALGSAMGTAK